MEEKKKVLEILKKNSLCVLSTSSIKGKSQSAVMESVVKDDLTILFNTEITTRKYKNVQENEQVSIVFGGWSNDPTIQIDGIARELAGQEEVKAKEYMLSVNPELKEYFNDEMGMFIEVKPIWVRYSDFSKNPPEVLEITDL